MKALVCDRYGGIETMRVAELADPRPATTEVIVAVKAASVNPVDGKVRSGALRLLARTRFPRALGIDFAGVVEELGAEVTSIPRGTPVYGCLPWTSARQGTHAALVRVRAQHVRQIPPGDAAGIDWAFWAALPCAGLTALVGLDRCGDIAGRRVLVNGATGGVGHLAVQIARARGAEVTAVTSSRNADFARELGASSVLRYDLDEKPPQPSRVVFDAWAHLKAREAMRLVERDGCIASSLPSPSLIARMLWNRVADGPRIVLANLKYDQELYASLERLVAAGALRPSVSARFPLDSGAEAFRVLEAGGVRGKVVIDIG